MLEVKWLEAGKDAACGSSRESTQRQPWLLVRHCARREDDYSWWVAAAAGISLEVKSWLPLSVKRCCLVVAAAALVSKCVVKAGRALCGGGLWLRLKMDIGGSS